MSIKKYQQVPGTALAIARSYQVRVAPPSTLRGHEFFFAKVLMFESRCGGAVIADGRHTLNIAKARANRIIPAPANNCSRIDMPTIASAKVCRPLGVSLANVLTMLRPNVVPA